MKRTSRTTSSLLLSLLLCTLGVSQAFALDEIDDDGLGEVTGEGLAISLTNYQTGWGATSYLEAVGTTVTDATLISYGFTRGDAYWYGGTYSGTSATRAWAGSCGAGIGNMGCPIGGLIAKFAPYDNPLLLRVFNYTQSPAGYQLLDYLGNAVTSANPRTIFEVLGPTKQDFFKFSWWDELRVQGTPTAPGTTGTLQTQVIMGNSKLISDVNGTPQNNKVRLFQTTSTDPTLGIIWENHFQGDFRFSANQQTLSADADGVTPMFSDYEGFYARNLKVYVPLGQLFYQSLIFDDTVAGLNSSYNSAVNKGDFVIELTGIPSSVPTVYNDFYGYTGAYSDGGAFTAQTPSTRYNETHGYFYVGTIASGVANNCSATPTVASACIKDTTDGIIFHSWHPTNASAQFLAYANQPDNSQYHSYDPSSPDDPTPMPYKCGNFANGVSPCGAYTQNVATDGGLTAGTGFSLNAVNLGDVAIKGMLIQHLKLTTLGAGG